jgi:hypothetical protein
MKKPKLGFLVLCLCGFLQAAPPYLLYFSGAAYTEPYTSNIVKNIAYINTLPFDGIILNGGEIAFRNDAFKSTRPFSYNEILSLLTPLAGKFTNLKYNFLQIDAVKSADFFDDWSVIINNWRLTARALKAAGPEFAGILFDNEEYYVGKMIWTYPADVDYASTKTQDQYIVQARLRGKQIMEACVAEFPEIKIITVHGPYTSEPKANVVNQGKRGILAGAFFAGMVEGQGPKSLSIDGGEVYSLRTVSDFAIHYEFRKFTIASPAWDSPLIPASIRPFWPDRVNISFGVDDNTPGFPTMTPAVFKTILENSLNRCDDFVWFFSEGLPGYQYLSGGAPIEWINAIKEARAATKKRTVGIIASKSVIDIPVGSLFNYKVKYYNYTGSPVSFSFPVKPLWITPTTDSVYGKAPTTSSLDTLMIIASAGAYKDTAKLPIRVSWYYSAEAENGIITAPMQIKSDTTASGGKYIATPAGTGNAVTPTAEATYSVNIPVNGSYYMWLLMYAPASGQYAVYADFNNTPLGSTTSLYQLGKYTWVLSNKVYNLTAGANTLKIGHKNEQVRIDKIVITSSPVAALPAVIPPNTKITGFNASQKSTLSALAMTSSGKLLNFRVYLNQEGGFSLRTYDISGKKIWEYRQSNCTAGLKKIPFDKSFLKNGVYMTELTSDNVRSVIKYSIVE